jgi:hypothetical protein
VQAPNARERSSRSRSTMFTSLGTALAAARGARILFVPENSLHTSNNDCVRERHKRGARTGCATRESVRANDQRRIG